MRFVWTLAALLWAAPLLAQRDRVQLDISVDPAAALQEGPIIVTSNLLADSKTRELLRTFPARIHYRVELWRKGGWFDEPSGRTEWDVLVQYDPTLQIYNVIRTLGDQMLENFGGFATLTAAEAQFSRPFRAPLHPSRSGRYYYNLIVDVQTLSESDLGALQEWLRGPSAPGKSNPLTALRSGLGTLLTRVLGGDKRHYETRSEVFRIQ